MAYLTQAEIEKAIGEAELIDLADRNGDGFADADVVTSAIGRTTGVIDSYLRSRFTLPLTEIPDLVRTCAIAIVRYTLADDHATDRIKDDYKQALVWLKDIREGNMDVGLTEAGAESPSTTGGVQIGGGRSAFDRDALDAFSGTSS